MTKECAKLGDIAHAVTIGSTLAFAYAVVKFAKPQGNAIFDSVWVEDGFCVANKDVPYWNSHDVCFYVDTIMAVVVGAMYMALKDAPGMGSANVIIKSNILGILGHGLGHGAIAKAIRDGAEQTEFVSNMGNKTILELLVALGPLVVFWVLLLKASMNSVSNAGVALAAIPSTVATLLIPPQFGFTYVQTVLMLAFSFNQLSRPEAEKDFAYALCPIMVGFPLSVVGWLESTACSSYVMNLGGHVIYDAYIPMSMIVFYLTCWLAEDGDEKVKTV